MQLASRCSRFAIIGAQKSGTTSLFKYLSLHPDIFMPAQKELEFFSTNLYHTKGVRGYIDTWFKGAGTALICGEASPQYMMYDYVPARMHESFPDMRLVAILRNPIDRARSHYMMAIRRNLETRSFDKACREQMKRGWVVDQERDSERDYIIFGEYGRIMSRYLEFFRLEQLKIVFLETLILRPYAVLEDICDFLGVKSEKLPLNISARYHKGSIQKRFPKFEQWMLRQELLKKIIKMVTPAQTLSKVLFWFDTELNVRKSEDTGDISNDMRSKLRDYYCNDVHNLEKLMGIETPWHEFRQSPEV